MSYASSTEQIHIFKTTYVDSTHHNVKPELLKTAIQLIVYARCYSKFIEAHMEVRVCPH